MHLFEQLILTVEDDIYVSKLKYLTESGYRNFDDEKKEKIKLQNLLRLNNLKILDDYFPYADEVVIDSHDISKGFTILIKLGRVINLIKTREKPIKNKLRFEEYLKKTSIEVLKLYKKINMDNVLFISKIIKNNIFYKEKHYHINEFKNIYKILNLDFSEFDIFNLYEKYRDFPFTIIYNFDKKKNVEIDPLLKSRTHNIRFNNKYRFLLSREQHSEFNLKFIFYIAYKQNRLTELKDAIEKAYLSESLI